uniref:Aminopeptidase Y n=1 Tax=uncultured marine group II/III euryarchaeote AD1000_17_B01 TaxID=1457731 RepID=A0A075FQS7_9EURY|nr:aminopeptidase Y [uncultured marine group II/III euryarchaeote AD1000_17_B01]
MEPVVDAEVIEAESNASKARKTLADGIARARELPMPVLVVSALILVGGSGGAILYGDEIVEWIQGEPDYQLIEFDAEQSRVYAQSLVDLGHPDWEGRLSGTIEEKNTADSIKLNFSSMGIPATLEEFDVPMFVIGSEPELSLCTPGDIGVIIGGPTPCTTADVNREIVEFSHREDFVLQGYSGSSFVRYVDDMPVIDLGTGNDSADWGSASNAVGLVWLKPETEGNTALFERAADNDLEGLILINDRQNCDELVADDCVPYFKSVGISSIDPIPDGLGFIMVSRSVGQTIIDEVINGDARLQFITDVNNAGTATIRVPCGIIEGKTESLVIFGAHHDTVYNGQGAVDDTSGVATLQEIARQFGLLEFRLGTPEMTLYFCTWGGEEEGLWGSTEWVDKHRTMLEENLRLYINLDMNHVDAERNSGLTMFGNNQADVAHITGVVDAFSRAYPELADKYPIDVRKLASTEMPYNSDHAPFVYGIDEDEGVDKDYGRAIVCYGSGSTEYHTYLDTMDRFNEESLMVSGIIYGSVARYLAYGEAQ